MDCISRLLSTPRHYSREAPLLLFLLKQVVPERTKDYISRPKPNGYRSVHLTVHINSIVLKSMRGSMEEEEGLGSHPQVGGVGCVWVRDVCVYVRVYGLCNMSGAPQ